MKENQQKETVNLHTTFSLILAHCLNAAKEDTAKAVEEILAHSKNYLGNQAHDALKDYYHLYFSDAEDVEASKTEANDDVTAIFEAATKALHEEDEESLRKMADASGDGDKEKNESRLRLSAINKKLEAIIRADASVKEKLLPIISNIQFEDLVNHRLHHIDTMWQNTFQMLSKGLSPQKEKKELNQFRDEFSHLCSSVAEKKAFYPIMLKEEAPEEDAQDSGVFLAF